MEKIFELYRELCGLFGENDIGEELHQQIHRIIQETIDRIPDEARIAIRPVGEDTKNTLRLYDFSRKNIVGIVDQRNLGNDFCGYPCFTMDSFSAESCDCMIISSHSYRQAIKEELEALHIPYIDFYDELEKQGIRLDFPHHNYDKSHPQLITNYYYLRYLRSEAGPQREAALNALLRRAVEYKDFVLIEEVYQECGGENGEFPLLKTVWRKSRQLLDLIQNRFLARKQKDIILFWTDAVPYSKLYCLPETVELSKEGVSFTRAFPPTAWTRSVFYAMFRGLLPIDDFLKNHEKIDSGNSPLIQFMQNYHYKIRLISDSNRPLGKEYLIEASSYEPCGEKFWKGIIDLLQSPEPCFYIFHFMESHPPFHAPDLKELVNWNVASVTQMARQADSCYGYIDRWHSLCHKLLGNKIQIFMSDHGFGSLKEIMMRFDTYVLHPYCFVVGEGIQKLTVTQFFPYTNFEKLIRWLVDPARFSLGDALTDDTIIQDIDYYHPDFIDLVIREGCPEWALAFRGIINYDYKYVINALGDEFFYQIQQDGSEKLVPLEDVALRAKLRDKCGSKFLDIYQYDQFRYSRKAYDAINQKRCGGNAT